jgi:excisionase family DNA binding protein
VNPHSVEVFAFNPQTNSQVKRSGDYRRLYAVPEISKSPEKFLSYQEVGAITKASQDQIKKWVSDGHLNIVHFGDLPRISEEEVNSFIHKERVTVKQQK